MIKVKQVVERVFCNLDRLKEYRSTLVLESRAPSTVLAVVRVNAPSLAPRKQRKMHAHLLQSGSSQLVQFSKGDNKDGWMRVFQRKSIGTLVYIHPKRWLRST